MTGICSRQQVKTQNPPVRLTRPEFYQESDFTPQVGGFFPVKPVELGTGDGPMRKRNRLQSTSRNFRESGNTAAIRIPVETQPRRNTTRNHVQFKPTRSCPTSTSGHGTCNRN